MALYYLSLAAVNQSKLARAPGPCSPSRPTSNAAKPAPIRRLALMVVCNVAACAEGRAAPMDASAVAATSAILSGDSGLKKWCVAALYAMSTGSPRFRALARAASADRPLMLIAEQVRPGVHKDMAQTPLRSAGPGQQQR
ncbi:U-box domain-containing protein 38-like [Panicum virgatum]|uniref:U-box domain-containing protein 38-like n=1 Tax=Panicum virgatum TaxID=38727 RepID=UPI0019D5CBF7|nr:U-box domain-containing protein 38-like [Panicum virgatum]